MYKDVYFIYLWKRKIGDDLNVRQGAGKNQGTRLPAMEY